jgi:LysR family glycine cleavage system transcriptional activator
MRTAAQLLREGKSNTAKVAFAVGFNSEAAFTRAFKREFGHPPATWRRRSQALLAFDERPAELLVSGTTTGVDWIRRHIGGFTEANPGISIQLEPNPSRVSFGVDEVDCAIHCGTDAPENVTVEELFKLDFTPMCSPEFLASNVQLNHPIDLLNVQRISPGDPWWTILWREFDIEPSTAAQPGVDTRAQVLDGFAAMRGQGVALLTPFFWKAELAEGTLVAPLPHIVIRGTEAYSLTYPQARSDWPKIRRFSEWLHRLAAPAVRSSQLERELACAA